MVLRWATLFLGILLAGCGEGEKAPLRSSAVSEIALPADLLLPEGRALAYRVSGPPRERLAGVRLPTGALARQRDDTGELLLLRRSERGYRAIAHRSGAEAIFADLVPGDYVLVPRPVGHLARSLGMLCRFTRPKAQPPGIRLPKICTQILCGGERFRGADLGREYGVPLPDDLARYEFGGWGGPTDFCRECTRLPAGDFEFEVPTLECLGGGEDVCEDGTPLLTADFEADTIGQPPSASPVGAPADDILSFDGQVEVVGGATNKAVEIERAGAASLPPGNFARLVGTLGAGADDSGRYCVAFTLGPREVTSPLIVTLESAGGLEAWQMLVGQGDASIAGSGPAALLSNWGITTTHDVRFDVDLGAGVFDASVDGSRVVSGQPLRHAGFDVPAHVQFRYLPTIVEAFNGRAVIDDLRVRKAQ